MLDKVSRRLIDHHPNNCFQALFLLPSRILHRSSIGVAVKLAFKPQGIALGDHGDIVPFTQKLSQQIFRAASITDITLKPGLEICARNEARLRRFLETGEMKPLQGLLLDVTIHPPIEQMIKEGRPIIDVPVGLASIPGELKHYTSRENYETIMKEKMLRSSGYQGRVSRICLTELSLDPGDAWKTLFIGSPIFANGDKGDYVLGFDLHPGFESMTERTNQFEVWFRGPAIKFGKDATLRFAGLNPVA